MDVLSVIKMVERVQLLIVCHLEHSVIPMVIIVGQAVLLERTIIVSSNNTKVTIFLQL